MREGMTMKRDPDVLGIEELAARLGISLDAAYSLCNRRDFPATKMGREWRIYWPAVASWMMERRENIPAVHRSLFDADEMAAALRE